MNPLQPEEIFACLDRHGVRYVLIGGFAAVLHGSPLPKDHRALPVLRQLLEEIRKQNQ